MWSNPRMQLYPYQIEGVRWLRARKRAFLADDPGLGKSAQLIRASVGRTLVVAPAMLEATWREELEKWADDPARFTWTSYHKFARGEHRGPWDTAIFDESHYLKGRKSRWTLEAFRLRTQRLYLATGTPVPNWGWELYTTIKLLHQGEGDQTPWSSYWRWIETWFHTWKPPWGGTKIMNVKGSWDKFVRGNHLDSMMLRRAREDVLTDLPPLTEQVIETAMEPAQRKLYNELKAQYLAWVEETGTEVSAFSTGGLHIKLAKIQTGVVTVDPEVEAFGSNKLAALHELLTEREGTPTLVVCHFRNTALAIGRLLDEMDLDWSGIIGGMTQRKRDAAKSDFQAGRLDVLVGTLDTISEGLTLTKADCCIFVERSWKPYKNEQAMRRVHRIGQDRPVSIIYLTTKDALDGRITRLLAEKDGGRVALLSAGAFVKLL